MTSLIQIYECVGARARVGVLRLRVAWPLFVCDSHGVRGAPAVKVAKHLAYLRARAMVETERNGNWIVYSLPAKPAAELEANLKCLQDCVQSDPEFRRDLEKLAVLRTSCCDPAGSVAGLPGPRR